MRGMTKASLMCCTHSGILIKTIRKGHIMETRFDAARILLQRLSPNEKLLWCDRPCSKLRISISDVYQMGAGIVWCAANLFMLFPFYLKTEGSAMLLCLAVFALFFSYGLYTIFSSFTQKSRRRKSAAYAITNKRVIFAKVSTDRSVKKWNLSLWKEPRKEP